MYYSIIGCLFVCISSLHAAESTFPLELFNKAQTSYNTALTAPSEQRISLLKQAQSDLNACPITDITKQTILLNKGVCSLSLALHDTEQENQEQEAQKALSFFFQSEHPTGHYNIARILHKGLPGVPQDPTGAYGSYMQAIVGQVPQAQINLRILIDEHPDLFKLTLAPSPSKELQIESSSLPESMYHQARKAQAEGSSWQALKLFKEVRTTQPPSPLSTLAALEQGRIFIEKNNFLDAATALNKAYTQRTHIPHSVSPESFSRDIFRTMCHFCDKWFENGIPFTKKNQIKVIDNAAYNATERMLSAPAKDNQGSIQCMLSLFYACRFSAFKNNKDKINEIKWLEASAHNGYPIAMRRYAAHIRKSQPEEAQKWIEKAATEHNDMHAQRQMGQQLAQQQETLTPEAKKWFSLAAAQGCVLSKGTLLLNQPLETPHAAAEQEKEAKELITELSKSKNSDEALYQDQYAPMIHKLQERIAYIQTHQHNALRKDDQQPHAGATQATALQTFVQEEPELHAALIANPKDVAIMDKLSAYYQQSTSPCDCITRIENTIQQLNANIEQASDQESSAAYESARKKLYRQLGEQRYKYTLEQRSLDSASIHALNEKTLDAFNHSDTNPNAPLYLKLSVIERHAQNRDEEGRYLLKALQVDPNYSWAQVALGDWYFDKGRHTLAKDCYEKCIPHNPHALKRVALMKLSGNGYVPDSDRGYADLVAATREYAQRIACIDQESRKYTDDIALKMELEAFAEQYEQAKNALCCATVLRTDYLNTVAPETFKQDYINLYRIRYDLPSSNGAITLGRLYETMLTVPTLQLQKLYTALRQAQEELHQEPMQIAEKAPYSQNPTEIRRHLYNNAILWYENAIKEHQSIEALYRYCDLSLNPKQYSNLVSPELKKSVWNRLQMLSDKVGTNPFSYYLAATPMLIAEYHEKWDTSNNASLKALQAYQKAAHFGDTKPHVVVPAACFKLALSHKKNSNTELAQNYFEKAAPYNSRASLELATIYSQQMSRGSQKEGLIDTMVNNDKPLKKAMHYVNLAADIENARVVPGKAMDYNYLETIGSNLTDTDYDECIERLSKNARENNNPDAYFNLGHMLISGMGNNITINRPVQAKKYLQKAKQIYKQQGKTNSAEITQKYIDLIPYHADTMYEGKSLKTIIAAGKNILDLFDGLKEQGRKQLLLSLWYENIIPHLPPKMRNTLYKRIYTALTDAHQRGNYCATIRLINLYITGAGYQLEHNLPVDHPSYQIKAHSLLKAQELIRENEERFEHTIWKHCLEQQKIQHARSGLAMASTALQATQAQNG